MLFFEMKPVAMTSNKRTINQFKTFVDTHRRTRVSVGVSLSRTTQNVPFIMDAVVTVREFG
jgi:hypothetical protein